MTPTHDIYLLPDTAGQEKWDRRFIAVAELVSTWSKEAVIIQSGITRVVHEYEELNDINSRWAETMRIGLQMYAEAHVEVVHR